MILQSLRWSKDIWRRGSAGTPVFYKNTLLCFPQRSDSSPETVRKNASRKFAMAAVAVLRNDSLQAFLQVRVTFLNLLEIWIFFPYKVTDI